MPEDLSFLGLAWPLRRKDEREASIEYQKHTVSKQKYFNSLENKCLHISVHTAPQVAPVLKGLPGLAM